ncbi:hypothetical protein DPMN_080005 [Dreissena polymorpha]|uniref:Uncharacterized protein n=1 Tax=Dreissena polymorpha TaxID=45954 RepID=A0A9D4BRE9_DREPO|nr:hypothetical protein DPMN_080005 [Dreissena polymorpha]
MPPSAPTPFLIALPLSLTNILGKCLVHVYIVMGHSLKFTPNLELLKDERDQPVLCFEGRS